MDTDVLRWFQQVADGVTVTEVSELEQVSQPGVSRALARLEQQVGAPLLRKAGRTLRMTNAGAAFKHHVDALLHQLDDGIAAVTQLVEPETGTVALAFQPSLGTWLVPELLSSFRSAHPGIRFALSQVRHELVSPGLDDYRIDLEITALRPSTRNVRWRRMLREPVRLVVPPAHPLAGDQAVDLAKVAQAPFVTLRRDSFLRQLGERLCERAGFRQNVVLEADDLPTLRGLVAAGLGVAIVPSPHRGPQDQIGAGMPHLAIDDTEAVREIGVTWRDDRRILPATELFRDHLLHRATLARLNARAQT